MSVNNITQRIWLYLNGWRRVEAEAIHPDMLKILMDKFHRRCSLEKEIRSYKRLPRTERGFKILGNMKFTVYGDGRSFKYLMKHKQTWIDNHGYGGYIENLHPTIFRKPKQRGG